MRRLESQQLPNPWQIGNLWLLATKVDFRLVGLREVAIQAVEEALLSQMRTPYKLGLTLYEEVESLLRIFHGFACIIHDFEALYRRSLYFKAGNGSCFMGS